MVLLIQVTIYDPDQPEVELVAIQLPWLEANFISELIAHQRAGNYGVIEVELPDGTIFNIIPKEA